MAEKVLLVIEFWQNSIGVIFLLDILYAPPDTQQQKQ